MSVFNFDNNQLGVSLTTYKDNNGGIWFPANETARILEFKNPKMAVINNVSVKDTVMFYEITENLGVQNSVPLKLDPRYMKKLMNEKAWWKLAMRSNAEIAENLQDWVFGSVLPSVRRQGFYAIPGVLERIQAIDDDEILSLEDTDRKEFRITSKEKSNLSKNPKAIARGKIGGGVTQQRRRDMERKIEQQKDDIDSLKEEIETLAEDNERLFEDNETMSEEITRLTFNESASIDKIKRLESEINGLRNLAFDYAETLDYQTEVIKRMETKINEKPENVELPATNEEEL